MTDFTPHLCITWRFLDWTISHTSSKPARPDSWIECLLALDVFPLSAPSLAVCISFDRHRAWRDEFNVQERLFRAAVLLFCVYAEYPLGCRLISLNR